MSRQDQDSCVRDKVQHETDQPHCTVQSTVYSTAVYLRNRLGPHNKRYSLIGGRREGEREPFPAGVGSVLEQGSVAYWGRGR